MATGYSGYVGYGDPERVRLDRQRQLAETLMAGASQTGPKNLAQGLSQLGQAFLAKGATDKADAAESAYATSKARRLAQFLNPNADEQGRNMAPDVNVSADPAPAPAQADPRMRALATALGGVYEGTGKTQPMGMTAAPMADVGAPSISMSEPVSMPMSAPQMPKPAPDRVAALRQALQMTGGDFEQARSLVEAKLGPVPAADKFQFLQGPDGSLSVGNQVTGEIDQRIAGTPKPPAPKEYDYKEVNGRVLAINKNDPTDQKDMGAATPKGSGANGEPSAYQLWQMQRAEAQDGIKANERDMAASAAVTNLKDGQQRVSDLISHPGFKGIYGPLGAFGINMGAKPTNIMNQDELNAMALLDQVGGEAFLAGVQKMRGTGPLSDNEGKRVSAAVTRLTNRMQSPEAAQAAAVEFRDAMQGLERAYARESGGASVPQQVQQPNMLDQIGGAVGGFMQNMMGGNRKPAPAIEELSDEELQRIAMGQ